MRLTLVAAVLNAAAASLGAAAAAFEPAPLDGIAIASIAAGLVACGVAAAAGTVATEHRWPVALAAVGPGFAAAWPWIGDLGPVGVAALVFGGAAVVANLLRLPRIVRVPRSVGAVPAAAVATAVVLVPWPVLMGLAGGDSSSGWQLAASVAAWVALVLYLRAVAWSVLLVRIVLPAAGIAAAASTPWPRPLYAAAAVVSLAVAAWLRPARLAAAPPPPTKADSFPIPPELTPPDILERAGLDEHGRPLA